MHLVSKLNTFCLYLAKPSVATFGDLLTVKAHGLLESGLANATSTSTFADGATLYVFPGFPNKPKWVPLLQTSFTVPDKLFSQSPCALVGFKKDDHIFALTFSYAHVYLDDAKTEANFGLKAVVNAVSDEKLRSVERSNIGAAIRDFAQAAGLRDLRSFGFDDALDLIRKVSGRATDNDFANMVTGARSLRFTKRIELTEVPDAAVDAVTLFNSTAYRKTGFKIIDFLSPVLDPVIESELDDVLVRAIRNGSDEFEIAIPEILPTGVGSFRFEHAGFSKFYPDLSVELYSSQLGSRLSALTLDDLKKHTVAAYGENENTPFQYWYVHDALVGSLVRQGERYALNEGYWYRIGKTLKESADRKFSELCGKPDKKLRPLKKKIYAAGGRVGKQKIAYQSEESYNAEIAEETDYLLLDQKLVQIDEVPGPGIEVCDLLDIAGRRFIHVKKSSRQSSVLSHFFKQGSNSARMLRQYEPFKAGFIQAVKKHFGQTKGRELDAALAKRWTIDFQIADFPRPDGTNNIPFFSKLTLREEARNIEAMGFDVQVNFIKLARVS